MKRWGKAGRSWWHVMSVAVLVAGLGVLGCGKKEVPATTDAGKSDPAAQASSANKPGQTPTTPVVSVPGSRDRLHQSFAEATRSADNPPPMVNRPPDETMTGLQTFKVLQEVQDKWDSIRFTDAAGKPIQYTATIETNFGSIAVKLMPELAPNHVRNFIALARAGYYDKLLFDRIKHEESTDANDPSPLKLDLIEAGCPVGSGDPASGSIGYWLKPEFNDKVKHEEGTIGACREFEPDTACTRFYITLNKLSNLDGNYTVFARVTSGLDVVRKIAEQPVIKDETEPDNTSRRPERPIAIKKVTIQSDAEKGAQN